MKRYKILLLSFVSAVLATSCCLPALLFVVFGVGLGSLSFLEALSDYRIPLSVVSIGFFVLYIARPDSKQSCCTNKKNQYIWYGVILFVLILVLCYPEFANIFFEE